MWYNNNIFDQEKLVTEYAFSLEEVAKIITNTTSFKLDSTPTFTTVFGYLFNTAPNTYWTSGKGKTLWETVYRNNYDDIIFVTDKETLTVDEAKKLATDFGNKFYAIWNDTKTYYEKLLDVYTAQESKLFDKLSTTTDSNSRFNDTPQNGGSFDDDEHTTNITNNSSTTSIDPGTMMERIDEVRRKYRDTYSDWAEQFSKLFVSHLNYED